MKKMNKAVRFFNKEELQRIEQTIKSVESRTIGEIAVMVVDSSDLYPEADLLGGVFLGSFVSLLLTVFFLDSSLWYFILISLVLIIPSQYLFRRYPGLKISLIGAKRRETAVRSRAIRAFYEKGLYKTRQNTGVLFFISILEHKVWILADKGIYEKIKQETLTRYAKGVSSGIKDGNACDALCKAIVEVGEILEEYFPVKPGDIDELTNKVITE